MISFKSCIAIALLGAGFEYASATIELPEIISDNMVLQRNTDARLWGWATPGSAVTVTTSWNSRQYDVKSGTDGRWDVAVSTPDASYAPCSINIQGDGSDITLNNVLIGEVWLASGQSNMEMPLRGFWGQPIENAAQAIAYSGQTPGIRVATVPKSGSYTPETRAKGAWKLSNPANAPEFSALGYFFAQSLNKILDVPVGLVVTAYGGSKAESWLPAEVVEAYDDIDLAGEKNGTAKVDDWHKASVRYNAMIHPIIGYTIKGAIWNQGESNVGLHASYPERMAKIAEVWRDKWGQGDFPFYQVEIPGWNYGDPDNDSAAKLREAQWKAAEIMPNGGIVCTSDLIYPYELEDIHACQKQPIGERLAFLAAADAYGMNTIAHLYPKLDRYELKGDKAYLKFKNASNRLTPNDEIVGFEVAGSDRVFHPAKVRQTWDEWDVVVEAPENVDSIHSVRYCFKNFAIGTVHDMMGLPLVPFRTDNW